MNKETLIRRVAAEPGLTIRAVQPVVNALFEQMAASLPDGDKIAVSSLGTFFLKERPAHTGYDPHRRMRITIPACKSVRYAVSPSLLRRLRERYGTTDE
ncbi:MAG: HU family DNA-binding protein [Alistipes sp.]|nr:HU family DNA-binding protein [Alistipes sp.]